MIWVKRGLTGPSLSSPSVVFWPGTLTPTTACQQAVTSFYCFPKTILSTVGFLIASYAKASVLLIFGFVSLFCSSLTQGNCPVPKQAVLGRFTGAFGRLKLSRKGKQSAICFYNFTCFL